jgi:hypothetical protein
MEKVILIARSAESNNMLQYGIKNRITYISFKGEHCVKSRTVVNNPVIEQVNNFGYLEVLFE